MLKHDTLRNTEVSTSFGKVTFDAKGVSNDLSKEDQEKLGNLHGFEYIGGEADIEKEEPKDDHPKVESIDPEKEEFKEEVKEEEPEYDEEEKRKEYSDQTNKELKAQLKVRGIDEGDASVKKDFVELLIEDDKANL